MNACSFPRVFLVATALSCAATTVPAAAQTAPLISLTVVQTTRSVQDWPLQVAAALGFFTANGLQVNVIIAGASSAVAQQLAAGSADIGSVSTTQVVEAIMGGAPLVQVLKNVATTPYALVARKGITSVEQLRGKTIMIGGPNDITRVFFDRLLAAHGLKAGDYTYTYAGSPSVRYAALLAGAIDATPLLPPTSFSAASQGYPIIDDSRKYFPNFPTSGYTANSAWASEHRPVVVAFIESFLEGVKWLYDPKNKERALHILEEATNTAPSDAERTYDEYTQQHLFSSSGRYETSDFPAVVDVLVRTNQIPAAPAATTKLYDDSFAESAARRLKGR